MNHLAAVTELADAMNAGGVPTDLDPRNLRAPCAWLSARSLDPANTIAGQSVDVDVYLIAPDIGTLAAHTKLTELLALALAVAGPIDTVDLDQAVTLPNSGPLPAYRYRTTVSYC